MNIYQWIFLAVIAALGALFIVEKVTGRRLHPYIVSGKPVVAAIGLLAKALSSTTNSEYMKQIATVAEAAVSGADYAEQLWLDDKIAKEDRAEYCHQFIQDALVKAGIPETEKLMAVADGCISIACALLPHGLLAKGDAE